MVNFQKKMFELVNRNHDRAAIMRRIDRDRDCDILAKKLNEISARRKKKGA